MPGRKRGYSLVRSNILHAIFTIFVMHWAGSRRWNLNHRGLSKCHFHESQRSIIRLFLLLLLGAILGVATDGKAVYPGHESQC